ncbi:MAG: sodium-independent anion transporter, partial [Caldilineaceae bacterium]
FTDDLAIAETHPGFTIYFFGAPLYFANANVFSEQISRIVEAASTHAHPLRWLVLDASAITDIDTSGAEALGIVIRDLEKQGIALAISRPLPALPGLLERYDLLDRIGRQHFYQTNRDARTACVHAEEVLASSTHALSSGPTAAATQRIDTVPLAGRLP